MASKDFPITKNPCGPMIDLGEVHIMDVNWPKMWHNLFKVPALSPSFIEELNDLEPHSNHDWCRNGF